MTGKIKFHLDIIKYLGNIKINGKQKKFKWIYFARYLREETNSNGYKIGFKALKNKLYLFSELGKSMVYTIEYKKFYKFAKKLQKKINS